MKPTLILSRGLTAFALLITLVLPSCKKESTGNDPASSDPVNETLAVTESRDEAETDAQYDDVFNITASMNSKQTGEDLGVGVNVSGLFELGDVSGNVTGRCFTITVAPAIPHVFPKTVTIDFGDGCLCRDGKYRKGKIVSIYTNPMQVPGAITSTTFVNYYVDSFKIEGTHVSENTSTSNMQGWKLSVIDGKITNTASGRWRKWNSTKSVLQVEGNGTSHYPLDDVYKITGSARSLNSAGHTWASLVVEPLIKKFTCRWIVKGTVRLFKDGQEALLDYGNGDCDNQAIIYVNGIPHPVTL